MMRLVEGVIFTPIVFFIGVSMWVFFRRRSQTPLAEGCAFPVAGPPFDPVLTFQGGIFFQKPKRKDGTVKADVVLIVCNEVLAVLWQPREAVIITRL